MYGITFNGKHSYEDYGLIMLSKNRSILPEPKVTTDEAVCMDGEYDYSEANPDEETKYKPRIEELTFSLDRNKINWKDPREIRKIARGIAQWFACGEKQLIFDDEPDRYELARVVNKLDLENQIEANRPFAINFKCRSFPFQIDATDHIILDSCILLDSDIRLDDVYSFNVTAPITVEVNNFGTRSVKPVVQITGTCSSLSLAVNENALNYSEDLAGETLEIDNELMQAIKGLTNKSNSLSGDFIRLIPGINEVQISGTGLNCTVSFIFRPQYY